MSHPDEASLHDFVDGELPEDEQARVAGLEEMLAG
jgi:anti-sigma factor RsiW